MLLADALANFARLALQTAVGLLFFRARQFAMASASGQRARDHERLLVAESKLKGVALRIWPLNSTANGRNFGANRAKTVPAAGANRQ